MLSETEYLGRAISDHSPLLMRFAPTLERTPVPLWRLDPALLEDEGFKQILAAALVTFFSENQGTASSPLVVWEAFKVVTREQCLGQTVGLRREIARELGPLEQQIQDLDGEMAGGLAVQDKLAEVQSSYNATWDRLRTVDLNNYRTRQHEEGGKAGRLLTWLVRPESRGVPILSVTDEEGNVLCSPRTFNEGFRG